eukprot:scaffold5779_cov108-Isochrysis_galbana.AAC.7
MSRWTRGSRCIGGANVRDQKRWGTEHLEMGASETSGHKRHVERISGTDDGAWMEVILRGAPGRSGSAMMREKGTGREQYPLRNVGRESRQLESGGSSLRPRLAIAAHSGGAMLGAC